MTMDEPLRFITFVIVEHFILFVKIFIDALIPDVPKSISRALVWKEVVGEEVLKKLKTEASQTGKDVSFLNIRLL